MVSRGFINQSFPLIAALDEGQPGGVQEVRNERALSVYNRVQNKITGRPFLTSSPAVKLMLYKF